MGPVKENLILPTNLVTMAVSLSIDTCTSCLGSGVVLVEGPCDTVPLEAPCRCLSAHHAVDLVRDVAGDGQGRRGAGRWSVADVQRSLGA
jgi:hypothetical protein